MLCLIQLLPLWLRLLPIRHCGQLLLLWPCLLHILCSEMVTSHLFHEHVRWQCRESTVTCYALCKGGGGMIQLTRSKATAKCPHQRQSIKELCNISFRWPTTCLLLNLYTDHRKQLLKKQKRKAYNMRHWLVNV